MGEDEEPAEAGAATEDEGTEQQNESIYIPFIGIVTIHIFTTTGTQQHPSSKSHLHAYRVYAFPMFESDESECVDSGTPLQSFTSQI